MTKGKNKKSHPSQHKLGSVAIFGAGISGLSAAHELSEKGYDVSFFISFDDVKIESEKKKIQEFLLGYREKISALIVSGKSQINTWMRKAANTLYRMLQ